MSTIIMSQCWPLQGLSVTQKAVLISLADQANDDGVCWPAVGTIAARCCMSARAVRTAMDHLEAVGLLTRDCWRALKTDPGCALNFDPPGVRG
ncbi:helix-turn-helix domain-containing protein [Stenotrophomonas pavanii]|uniref:helix-turn-helix domain-containing protein n=1 Tax=Stenotrophomonas pavanii TaxID=487698 RepID=UPI0020CDF811|nr:helix-turn-helix domain-containing protein [Stenotrophomonas pavanii]